jgi:[ribosomal protein S5]-alanine N-acetyltransferase
VSAPFYRLGPEAWGSGVATEAATAVVDWATVHRPDRPVIARVRPDNIASAKVAARAGLHRAEHLDTDGEDGLDWIFAKNWPVDIAWYLTLPSTRQGIVA